MKNTTIAKRIIFGFALVIVIVLALGTYDYNNLGRIASICSNSNRLTKSSVNGVSQIQAIGTHVREIYILTLKHHLTEDSDRAAATLADIKDHLAHLNGLIENYEKNVTGAEDIQLLQAIKDARPAYATASVNVLMTDRANLKATMSMVDQQLVPAYDKFIAAIDAAIAGQQEHTEESSKNIMAAVGQGRLAILVGLCVAIATAVCVSAVIVMGVRKTLNRIVTGFQESSTRVIDIVGHLRKSSASLAEDTNKQASSIEETSSSLEEMAVSTQSNSENAREATELAKQARTAAESGAVGIKNLADAMEATKTASDDVASIIRTIDEIAFQTNILALNAAVEAARAGEAGKGFAVVAAEVRNLAQRSAEAARETTDRIECAVNKTAQSVEICKQSGTLFYDIVAKIRRLDDLAAQVSVASREQKQGIDELNKAVSEIEKVTQMNAASSEEGAAAAHELDSMAHTMKRSLTELLALVGSAPSPVQLHRPGMVTEANGAAGRRFQTDAERFAHL